MEDKDKAAESLCGGARQADKRMQMEIEVAKTALEKHRKFIVMTPAELEALKREYFDAGRHKTWYAHESEYTHKSLNDYESTKK